MTSIAECLNRYRVARRTADAILRAHAEVGATLTPTDVAEHMDDAAWETAAGQRPSETTKALTRELLREHEAREAGAGR